MESTLLILEMLRRDIVVGLVETSVIVADFTTTTSTTNIGSWYDGLILIILIIVLISVRGDLVRFTGVWVHHCGSGSRRGRKVSGGGRCSL